MPPSKTYFWPVKPPTPGALDELTHKIAKRVSRYLERSEHLYRDAESEYLDLMPDGEDAIHGIIGASITYRLAFGTNAGRKALTLQAAPTSDNRVKSSELASKQSDGAPLFFHCMQASSVSPTNEKSLSVYVGTSQGLPFLNRGCRWAVTVM